jgi:phosphotransferase system enzyme I (PtsI)
LRALLRAAAHGPLRIMFPFVSSVQEVRDAKNLLLEAQEELTARGLTVPDVPVGIMIEVPSAAFTASLLAKEADFFTIGTNDLIQYTLAVDRTDDRVSNRYEPLHPAILRLLRHVRRAAARQGIVVSVCGEMASDPLLLKLLIGCGLREFSMTPGAIPMARRVVKETSARQMMRVAARVLTLGTVEEIEQYLGDEVAKNEVGSEG